MRAQITCVWKQKVSRPHTSVLFAYIYHGEQNHRLLIGADAFPVKAVTSVKSKKILVNYNSTETTDTRHNYQPHLSAEQSSRELGRRMVKIKDKGSYFPLGVSI